MTRIEITIMEIKKSGLTILEICVRLGISRNAIYKWFKAGVPLPSAYGLEAVTGLSLIPKEIKYEGGNSVSQ